MNAKEKRYFHKLWKLSVCRVGSVFRFDAFGKLVYLRISNCHYLFGVRFL